MNRPLFRQAGGSTEMMPQDMMPQDMMAAPPIDPAMEAQVMEVEAMGMQAGAQAADDMMMKLDGAEDYQTLIDGIRGNEMPLEARYQELAGLVGEEDAMATPESVLTLTQPTIMMTEQGAMDSGIGELMQGLTSEQDMGGQMEEGVGSLMMAGAGNTPPVNFSQGGPVEVQGYAPGGVIETAQKNAPAYQAYFQSAMDSQARAADLEEQKKMSQAQMLFDIAGTALNFAGQTKGGSIAERLANAATQSQLTDKIGARSAGILEAKRAQAAEDRQMRMAGLQASLTQSQTDEASRQALELAKLKKTTTKSDRATLYGIDSEGNLNNENITFNLNEPLQLKQYNEKLTSGKYLDDKTVEPLLKAQEVTLTPGELKSRLVTKAVVIDGVQYEPGEIAELTLGELTDFRDSTKAIQDQMVIKTFYKKGEEPKAVITNDPLSRGTLDALIADGWTSDTTETETAAKKEIITFEQGLVTIRDKTLNEYTKALTEQKASIDKKLLEIKGSQSEENILLTAELRDKSALINSELKLNNSLKVFEVKSIHEIDMLDKTGDQRKELLKLGDALSNVQRQNQNAFTAAESVLNRVAARENKVLENNFRSALQEQAQLFKLGESEKDRVFRASESALSRVASLNLQVGTQEHTAELQKARLQAVKENNLTSQEASALEGALNRASRLTLQVNSQEFKAIEAEYMRDFKGTEAEKKAAALLLQNTVKNAMTQQGLNLEQARDGISAESAREKIILDREKFELEKTLSSKLAGTGTDATIKALANEETLTKYANNTLNPSDANAFDLLISYWSTKGAESYSPAANNGQGGYIKVNMISPALRKAIAARAEIIGEENVPDVSGKTKTTKIGTPGSVMAYRFNDDGGINFDSFAQDPTLAITGVDLTKSQGFASGFNRFVLGTAETLKDLTVGYVDFTNNQFGKVTREADAQLKSLARRTISVAREGVDGRIFALDMNLLEEEVSAFKPGAFKQDRAALDQLYVTRNTMALKFKDVIQVINNAPMYTKDQVTKARAALPKLEELLGDYTGAILVYERALNSNSKTEANNASDQVISLTSTAERANNATDIP